jgi:carbon storage regulator
MLVLTRRVGESLSIGDAVTVTVTAVNGTHVRLGIEAPPEVLILREELQDKAKGEPPEAA